MTIAQGTSVRVGVILFVCGVFLSTSQLVFAKTNTHGEKCEAAIGNTIWYDHNVNGVHDANEPGISNAKVKLYNGDKVETQRTNSRGRYKFTNLCEGTYRVVVAQEKLPKGCVLTHDRDGKKNSQTEKYLKVDQYYRKADFGYKCTGVAGAAVSTQKYTKRSAPQTGSNGTIVAFVGALTVATMFVVARRKKQKSIVS